MSIVFNSTSLRPHVRSFEEEAVPYLLRADNASGMASVFVTIPNTSTALQINSAFGLTAQEKARNPWDFCAKE